jgi:ribosome assembly protein SQT1
VHQLKSSGSKALFTCVPLLSLALEAAAESGIPRNRVYLLALPKEATGGVSAPSDIKTVDQLIEDGAKFPALEKLKWEKGQGARQTAFLCYSSGTSGLPVRRSSPCGVRCTNTCLKTTERRHDLPPKRHIKRLANIDI